MSSDANASKRANGTNTSSSVNGAQPPETTATPPSVRALIPQEIPNLSTGSLESKLGQLREAAQEQSQVLTQKLASSSSGQNLLHIGTSLSTLPPDLHTLLTHMHPFVNVLEDFEKDQRKSLINLVEKGSAVRQAQHRVHTAERAADLYADLTSAETCIREETQRSRQPEDSPNTDVVGT
jgi:hypothetical protein